MIGTAKVPAAKVAFQLMANLVEELRIELEGKKRR